MHQMHAHTYTYRNTTQKTKPVRFVKSVLAIIK